MTDIALQPAVEEREAVTLRCRDDVVLGGDLWYGAGGGRAGHVIINAATGVLARYYHRYARFLARHGFTVLTYDYRGIGASRPKRLRGCRYRWRDWGDHDVDAALAFMHARRGNDVPLMVVGHSIGGFLPGQARNGHLIDRLLTVGAQYAWWRDYAPEKRLGLFVKWHIGMPIMTALFGYFPGQKLGWLEDLPAGVANEWSFRGPRFERSHPHNERSDVLARMRAVTAPILAVTMSDDQFATVPAVQRALNYYTNAPRTAVLLRPADYGLTSIGHFDLFHDRHASGFWLDTLLWLRDGHNPWPEQIIDA